MAGKVRNIKDLIEYIRDTRSKVIRAHTETLFKVVTLAEAYAKKNATKNFIGRNGRRLSGRLLNSIYGGVDPFTDGQLPRGFIGTRGVPYGKIHEEGGTISVDDAGGKGVAKWLWIKQHGGAADAFRRMTPYDFYQKMKSKDRRFKIIGKGTPGKLAIFQALRDGDFVKLFALAKSVEIPKRPYLRPAVEQAVAEYGKIARQVVSDKLKGGT